MDDDLYIARLKKVRQLLKSSVVTSFVFTDAADVRYLSGFTGDDSWLVLTRRKAVLITDSRYTAQAHRQCPACKIVQRRGSITSACAEMLNKAKSQMVTGIDAAVSVGLFTSLKKQLTGRLKSISSPAAILREIKDSSEISDVIAAAKIAGDALAKLLPQIRYRMTENHIAGMLDFEIRKAGAVNSFETIVAFGSCAAMAHHSPSNRRLKNNDSILIDFGAVYRGYCSDITRCFAFGKVSKFYADAYKAIYDAQSAAIAEVKDAAEISDVENAAKNVLKAAQLPLYGHGTGHGLGLKVHESPVVSAIAKSRKKARLKAGQVITVEPGVYIEGKFGIRIEDDVLVTPTGARILTKRLAGSDVPIIDGR